MNRQGPASLFLWALLYRVLVRRKEGEPPIRSVEMKDSVGHLKRETKALCQHFMFQGGGQKLPLKLKGGGKLPHGNGMKRPSV